MKKARLVRKLTDKEIEAALVLGAEDEVDFLAWFGGQIGEVVEHHVGARFDSRIVHLEMTHENRHNAATVFDCWIFEEIE